MFVRRAFYYWQVAAVVVLPLWILIGWSVFGGSGWQFLLVMLSCGALALALAGVGVLIYARKGVRQARAVSWADVAVLALWHAAIVAVGFLTPAGTLLATAVVIVGLAAFWLVLSELFRETRRRVQGAFDSFQAAAQMGAGAPRPPVVANGEYIVIDTARSHEK
ncbi:MULTISPECIES: MFS transporter [Subtercola]|uniref:MFS transporter n=1 Tax=Subtercola vilae TaxID=2056433 RepID=A0A4T2C6W3_9MICO|nr:MULTISPECIES: MFS transporter [Subtercola]MEA9985686.1 hypothetical protein [Subtercola sp. RTI3]TIH38256.1 MFS transporter [Subtercola vilae]